jgi:uroporphyrinogen decarboxylase
MEEVRSLKPIDPLNDGYMPRALEELQHMWDHLDPMVIERYGYLDGVAMSFGPVEFAAVLLGHRNFYLNLFAEPELMHELLKITTDSVIRWLKAQEKVNGRLKRLGLADHLPGQISEEHFEEFWLPYSNQVVEEFPDAVILYHNEYPVPYLDALKKFKFYIWHFGGDLASVKDALGDSRTLMGNLDPIGILFNGSPETVYEKALACLEEGAPGGRFLLSSGGGLAPGTPKQNLKQMERALEDFVGGKG